MRKIIGFHLCLLLAVSALAQTSTGRIVGTVQDGTGALVPGAAVVATNEETGISFNTVTSDGGKYVFEALQPGPYTVTVEASGFKKYVSARNIVTANDTITINVPVETGDLSETVEVVGSYERVQTSQSGNFGNVVNERSLEELPVPNRNPLSLIRIQPGVAAGSNTTGNIHVFGSRDRAFNITLDGIDANETSAGNAEFSPIRTNPDSLREYRVITSNPSAEFGRNSGAQVGLITKSGTNEFSGNLFWFHRNRVLNANESFLNRQGLDRRFLLRNQFGGSIGGPVYLPRFGEGGDRYYSGKNRTFFFFNTQIQRQTQTLEQVSTVYTAQARAGVFRYSTVGRNRPFNTAGASVDAQGNPIVPIASYTIFDPRGLGFDPTVAAIINLTPLPNTFEVGDGLNTAGFRSLATRTDPQRDFTLRIDHNINQTQNLFFRYSFGQQDTVGDTTNSGAARFPGLPPIVATFRSPKNLAMGLRSTFGPRATNELIVGGNRFVFDFAIPSNLDPRATPFLLQTVTDPLSSEKGNKRTINTFQIVDNFSLVMGAHTLRFGTNLRLQQHYDVRGSIAGLNAAPRYSIGGTVSASAFRLPSNINSLDLATVNGMINNLLGRVGSGNVGLAAAGNVYAPAGSLFTFDAWYPEGDFYFQDDWKVRPNLTMNIGLRWEPKPKPYTRGSSVILVPNKPVTLGAPPANDISFVEGDLYKSDWNNFGPAIGVAYDPFGDGRTALRANFRVAFDRISTFLPSSAIFPNSPGTTTAITFSTSANQDLRIRDGLPPLAPSAGLTPDSRRTPPAPATASLEVLDPNFKTPTTYMFSAGLQRDLGKGFVFQTEYVGRAGRNLIGGYERNLVDIFDNGFLQAFRTVQAGGTSPLLEQLLAPLRGNQTALQYIQSQSSLRSLLGITLVNGQVVGPPLGTRNNVAGLAANLNTTFVSGRRLIEAAGLPSNFFNDYPQFLGGLQVIDSNSFSNYHGGVFQLSRRFSDGLQFDVSYVYSKSLDDKSYDPVFTRISGGNTQSAQSTPFDNDNRRLTYGISDFDRTHVLQGNVIYALPFGRGQRFLSSANGFVSRLLGGFTFTSTFVYQSGLPFNIVAGNNTYSNRTSSRVNYSGSDFSFRYTIDPATGVRTLFTPEQLAQFSNPGPGELGNVGRNAFRLPPNFNIDAALIKRVPVNERVNFEFRAEAFNLTNTPYYGFPDSATLISSSFGRIIDPSNSARIIQLGAKLNF